MGDFQEAGRPIADLAAHFAAAYLCGLPIPSRQARALLYWGALLPDLCFKGLLFVFQSSIWFGEPIHSLWGGVLVSYACALLFERPLRRMAFASILGGYLTHLALDVAKDNLGMGAVLLFFPSMKLYECGLYPPETSLDWAPFALGAVFLMEWFRPTLFERLKKS